MIPEKELGNEYIVMSFRPMSSSYSSDFTITSTSNDTTISMNFTAETSFNGISYASGDVLTITVYQLQSLLFQSRSDLTVTKVSSDKPIAVVSGNLCRGHTFA